MYEITAAIQSIKTAIHLVKAAHGLANYSELLTAVTSVQEKLTDAIASELASQEKQAVLAERVRELEKQIAEIEDWRSQVQRFALFQFPTRALAYALKSGMENGEPMHYSVRPAWIRKRRLRYNRKDVFCIAPNARLILRPKVRLSVNRGRVLLPA